MKSLNQKIDHLFSKINWSTSPLDAEAIQIMNTIKYDIAIEQASQQITGFALGADNGDEIALIESMGLKKDEWEVLRSNAKTFGLKEQHIDSIESHFNK